MVPEIPELLSKAFQECLADGHCLADNMTHIYLLVVFAKGWGTFLDVAGDAACLQQATWWNRALTQQRHREAECYA